MHAATALIEYLVLKRYKVSAEENCSTTLVKGRTLYTRQYKIAWIGDAVIIESALECISGNINTSGSFQANDLWQILSKCSFKEGDNNKFIESRFLAHLTDDNPSQAPVKLMTKPVLPKVGLGESPPQVSVEPASNPLSSEDENSQQIQQILQKLNNYFIRPEAWYHIHVDRMTKDKKVRSTLAAATSYDGILTACTTIASNHDGRTATIFAELYQLIQQLPEGQRASFVRAFKDYQSKYLASSQSNVTSPTAGF